MAQQKCTLEELIEKIKKIIRENGFGSLDTLTVYGGYGYITYKS